jgi:prepilin-type N-terminal cleavage/methylation domain-containing protein/prepilin-type processing-associated H-X9-DG protein
MMDVERATGCNSGHTRQRRSPGFTLLELLIVLGIIAAHLALILPALSRGRAAARQSACLSNLHAIGLGVADYANTYDFPPYFLDAITLENKNYALSWSDFLAKGRNIETDIDIENIPSPDGSGGMPGIYLAGMVSQRAKIFQCSAQIERVWGDVAGVPVSYRSDFVATGYVQSRPVAGVYRDKKWHRSSELIWLGEAFTTLGGIGTREYVRETQLQIDRNEANPLRHAGAGTYLFGDGHAEASKQFHVTDFNRLAFPWEPPL